MLRRDLQHVTDPADYNQVEEAIIELQGHLENYLEL